MISTSITRPNCRWWYTIIVNQFPPSSTQWQAGIGTAWGTWWSLWSTQSPASPPSSSSSCSPSSSPPCSGCRFSGANLTRTVGRILTGSCPARWPFSRYPRAFPRTHTLWKKCQFFFLSVRHAWAVSTTNNRAWASSFYLWHQNASTSHWQASHPSLLLTCPPTNYFIFVFYFTPLTNMCFSSCCTIYHSSQNAV